MATNQEQYIYIKTPIIVNKILNWIFLPDEVYHFIFITLFNFIVIAPSFTAQVSKNELQFKFRRLIDKMLFIVHFFG